MTPRQFVPCSLLLVAASCSATASESYETAPVRPDGGAYVPPPFVALRVRKQRIDCLGREYDMAGVTPIPAVGGRPVLRDAGWTLDGERLVPPPLRWTLTTPAVCRAERAWKTQTLDLLLTQTIEYDGFVTHDLTIAPRRAPAAVEDLSLRLTYLPETAVLYHIPVFRPVWAGHWPDDMAIEKPIVGVWGGNEEAGFASYVASFRDWHGNVPRVRLQRQPDGSGMIEYRIVSERRQIDGPVTYRLGFIATPVKPCDERHLQLFSLSGGADKPEPLVDRVTIWAALSDHYPTFRTNDPTRDADKRKLVDAVKGYGNAALAYTTYDHVEEGTVDVPPAWPMLTRNGQSVSRSIGGSMGDRNRVFLCTGSRDWVAWKTQDLRAAVEGYGVDGFYVDTSYVISPCANAEHGHGWPDADGERQADFPVWSMREIWRQAYELVCRARGRAEIYAHHKGGCTAALAAFTSAFCDGEQFTSVPITHMTLDGFRAQVTGRPFGPRGTFISEYYRSAVYKSRGKARHHNPLEGLMFSLVHDVLPVGYPGLHPAREIALLRDDLELAEAEWGPYYAPDNPWRLAGADAVAVSSYRSRHGDTVLVLANPAYEPARGRLVGPGTDFAGRTFVDVDVLSRLGRASRDTPGYRWESADPRDVEVGARAFRLCALVRRPEERPGFADRQDFLPAAETAKGVVRPDGTLLVDDCEDPDWVIVNDDGAVGTVDSGREGGGLALRVAPRPRHRAAALLLQFAEPRDWTGYGRLTLSLRPDTPMPVRALDVRLRNSHRYGPPMELESHATAAVLPGGEWSELSFRCGTVPRELVQILRVYYHRGELCRGPFAVDNVVLHPEAPDAPATATGSPDEAAEGDVAD